MTTFPLIRSLALAGAVAFGVAGTAMAQSNSPNGPPPGAEAGPGGFGHHHHGRGMHMLRHAIEQLNLNETQKGQVRQNPPGRPRQLPARPAAAAERPPGRVP